MYILFRVERERERESERERERFFLCISTFLCLTYTCKLNKCINVFPYFSMQLIVKTKVY